MADHQEDQQHHPNLNSASEDDANEQETSSALPENIGNSTGNGQTALSILTTAADDSASSGNNNDNALTSVGGTPLVSQIGVTHQETGVDAAAHSSCSSEQAATTATTSHSSQIGGPPKVNNSDSEMAVVSESMANASLTPRRTDEQISNGGVVQSTSADVAQPNAKAAAATLLILPAEPPSKPRVNESKRKKKRALPPMQPGQSSGRWTHAEHEAFLDGLKVYGREWKKVAKGIPTRTSAQVRSHAQKYFSKLARDEQLIHQETQAFEAAAAAAAAGSADSTASSAGSTSQPLPPGVQRNVERILANPEQAQREVEHTLRALRERYRLLQQRLGQEQPQNHRGVSPSHRIEEEKEEEEESTQQSLDGANQDNQQQRQGKRRREGNGDDCSTSSSTRASLGDEELIALSVLGGSLPNGGGAAPQPQPPALAEGQGHSRQHSNSSLDSTSTNHSKPSNSGKRKREEN